MCVRKISAQCVLQFTPSLAAGCVLHRPVSRVIHCSELSFGFKRISTREILFAFEIFSQGNSSRERRTEDVRRFFDGKIGRGGARSRAPSPRSQPNRSTGSGEPSRRRTPDFSLRANLFEPSIDPDGKDTPFRCESATGHRHLARFPGRFSAFECVRVEVDLDRRTSGEGELRFAESAEFYYVYEENPRFR